MSKLTNRDIERIIKQWQKEKPVAEIAQYFQVTRQRIYQILTTFNEHQEYPKIVVSRINFNKNQIYPTRTKTLSTKQTFIVALYNYLL